MLGRYLQAWSMPEYRIVMTGRQGRARIEIYFFPPAASGQPARLRDRGAIPPSPRERSGSRRMDDGAGRRPGRGKRGPGVRISVRPDRPQHREHGRRRTAARDGASPLAPEKWTAKAILIDELRVKARRWSASRSGARRSSCNGWCPSARRRPRSSWIRDRCVRRACRGHGAFHHRSRAAGIGRSTVLGQIPAVPHKRRQPLGHVADDLSDLGDVGLTFWSMRSMCAR